MSNSRSFWPAFQKRWAAVLCEQTEGLQGWSENMTQALRHGILEVPNSSEAHAALAQLNVRLSRLESTRGEFDGAFLDPITRSLFIGYGSAILSAPRQSALSAPVAGGVLQYGEVKSLLDDLCEWLRQLKIVPRRVFFLQDFDSQVIGLTLARQLDVEASPVDGNGFTHSKSLIVSADNRPLLAPPLRTVFPAQVLFSFNLHRVGAGMVPDVAALAAPDLLLPWQGERFPSRSVGDCVELIIRASHSDADGTGAIDSDRLARLDFYRARRQWLTAGNSCYARPTMLPEQA